MQRETEELFGASFSQIGQADHRNGNAFFSRTSKVPEIDDLMVSWGPVCEPVRYSALHPRWRRLVDFDYIDERGMDRSDFYRACDGYGIRYRLALRLVDTENVSKALLWFWPERAGPPQRAELETLTAIEAPLRMAAAVSDELGASIRLDRGIVDALDGIHTAALLAEPTGAVRHANQAATALLEKGDGLKLGRCGRLSVAHPKSADALDRALAEAGRALTSSTAGGCQLSLKRRSHRPPYLVTVVPLSLREQLFGPARPILLLLISDPTVSAAPSTTMLRDSFGFTSAEASVAILFAQGRSLSEIAELRKVGRETVRTQIKALLAKTGVRRQAELMSILQPFSRAIPRPPFGG